MMIKLVKKHKVHMSDVVSLQPSRAAQRAIKKAVLESIKDQAHMTERAKQSYQ